MRLVLTSDTHGKLPPDLILPEGDILIHAGDATMSGTLHEMRQFAAWMKIQPHAVKLFVPGNHDFIFQPEGRLYDDAIDAMRDAGVEVLIDRLVFAKGLAFYGSPWTPEFGRWAFELPKSGPEIAGKWAKIPDDLDVLITHGPPWGILDVVTSGEHAGCEMLRERLDGMKHPPRLHAMGHLHEARGSLVLGATTFMNVAALDERYRLVGSVAVVHIMTPEPRV